MPGMKQTTDKNPFGETENKSAEALVTEAKSAAPAEEPETARVKLIHHINAPQADGSVKAHVPGEVVELPLGRATELIGARFAEPASDDD